MILLDVVLGYGSHADPASELVPAIHRARDRRRRAGSAWRSSGRSAAPQRDPQDLERQSRALTEAGMLLTESNAQAVRLAAAIVGADGTRARPLT